MRGLTVAVSAAGAAAAAGCVPEVDPACLEEAPVVEIGAGTRAFEAIEPEARVAVEHGPQGGYHVVYALRILGMEPVVEVAHRVVSDEDGTVLSDHAATVRLDPGPEPCVLETVGQLAVLDVPAAEVVDGQRAWLAVDVTDRAGRRGSAEVAVELGSP